MCAGRPLADSDISGQRVTYCCAAPRCGVDLVEVTLEGEGPFLNVAMCGASLTRNVIFSDEWAAIVAPAAAPT